MVGQIIELMKKVVVVIVTMLFCITTKAQQTDTISIPIHVVSSTGLGEVLDSCINMNCFQKGNGSTGVYLLNVLNTAASVFTINECYVLQNDILKLSKTLSVYYIIQYKSSIFLVSGRAILKDGVRPYGDMMKVITIDHQLEVGTDDTFFPCTAIVNRINGKYFFKKID